MRSVLPQASRISLLLLLIAGLLVAGCDSGGAMDDEDPSTESATVSGQATDEQAADGSKASKAAVEGATVTAVSVHADGTTTALDGEATTDANGAFTIDIEGEGASGIVRLDASGEGDYSSSVIVLVNGQSEVNAQPMTVETAAEAEVYVEAEGEDGGEESDEGVTPADVAAYVDANTAAAVEAGATSAADAAMAIRNAVEAEASYHSETNSGVDFDAVADAKSDAYAQLQAELAAASDTEAQASAVESFEATIGSLYAEAGASAQSQAEGRQAGTSLVIEFSAGASSDAELGLRKQAELLRAYATTQANEAVFEAEGAAQTSLDALASAREALFADLRSATSVEAIVEAKGAYEMTVKDELEASFDVNADLIASAETSIEEGALAALETALANLELLLGDAIGATVDAYTTFYTDARSAAETALESSADAEACATVIVTLEAF